ncbi:hypothetical protein B0T17DRAFT_641340 [Bombardia bombarda]|uniref:Glycosyltransferase family 28 N-terminal domain-containing protein n=1 Tax=Bombardia bombarda TaxID=252184 RepID=A0AA39WTR7_9PEZI|nr:hypothetical protein B0T17DRAFT_641340 [Bombardia bombarda]
MSNLDSQPSFASSSEAENAPVRLESIQHHGHPVTVVRDAAGNIVYPAPVPPETQSPEAMSPTSPPERQHRKSDPTPTTYPPEPHTTETSKPEGATRPSAPVTKQWATELPGSSRQPPPAKRSGTSTSKIGTPREDVIFSSSESSSSSEDEDDRAGRGTNRKAAAAPKPKHRSTDDHHRRFHVGNQHYMTKGKVSKRDGRLNISVKDTSNTGYLAKALGTAVQKVMPPRDGTGPGLGGGKDADATQRRPSAGSRLSSASTTLSLDKISCPKLNIVIMVIGSRGDAQPFLKIGKVLKEQCGHRVRIATHPAFRDFVEKDSGLEFFSVGGDPSELMAFMVKNPGMIPTLETVKAGDISRRRAAMAEMFEGFWRACINASDNEKDARNAKMMGERDPFVADAIIANPPSFAHVHCAEALGIPLHLMFTFPYTPTQAFPHPLASIKKSNVDPGYTNFISYPLVEMMVWQGLGDLVNDFRVKTLGLDPVSTLWAPGATYRLHVPFTYLWSPGLVPKPEDWGDEVDVSGFVFLDLASSFNPPDPLTKFLDAGEDPIYIGFGSIVVDDADRFTDMIFEAVKSAGVRALVSKGWGGLGGDSLDVPENIFMLDNTPHDWLFPKVRATVIHGGAGTTAIALKCGKPTMVVPFFGDQHFWGSMISEAKAGPEPVPYKSLTAEKLAEGIKYCLTEEAVKGAEKIAKSIELEGDGAENACRAFHKHLNLAGKNSMRCSILEDRVACWQLKNTNMRLSPMAANFAVEKGYASWKKLRLLRHNEWNDFEGPGEPVTGVAGSLMSSVGDVFGGIGGVPYRVAKGAKKRTERKKKHEKKKEEKRKQIASSSGGKKNNKVDEKETGSKNNKSDKKDDKKDNIQETREDRSPMERRDTQLTSSTLGEENPAEEIANEVGKGAAKTATALARAPVDLSLALAQGFHNAPRLYGDDTVRRPTRVTGIKSGLRAAGHEFVFGIYDGWTGVVRLPVRGARDGGLRGFVTGVGMGLTGFVLKDIAAIIGPVGYTLKGIVKQAERGRQPYKYVRRARIVQGQREVRQLGEKERQARDEEVVRGWEVMRELWEALEREERRIKSGNGKGGKGAGLKARLAGVVGRTKRKRGLGAAFESAATARKALEALREGDGVEAVVGRDRGRKGSDHQPQQEGNQKDHHGVEHKEVANSGNGNCGCRAAAGRGDDAEEETAPTPDEDEKENPFAPNSHDVKKNKADSRQTMDKTRHDLD